jgi:hypothetical protein
MPSDHVRRQRGSDSRMHGWLHTYSRIVSSAGRQDGLWSMRYMALIKYMAGERMNTGEDMWLINLHLLRRDSVPNTTDGIVHVELMSACGGYS